MLAATAVPLALNWTDVIKTRMQSPPAAGSSALGYSAGFGDTARRILAEEGPWRLWSTGMPASMLREVLVVGTRVGAYPLVRDEIYRRCYRRGSSGGVAGGEASLVSKVGAGIFLGAVSGLLASPCDLVRIRMQAEAGLSDASTGRLTTGLRAGLPRQLHNTPQAFVLLCSEAGVREGLLRGASANVLHSCCITVGTVPVYEHTKYVAKSQFSCQDGPALHCAAGFIAGLVGTTAAAPADVVRTRIMGANHGGTSGRAVADAHGSMRQIR